MSASILNNDSRVRRATFYMQRRPQFRRSISLQFRTQFRLFMHQFRIGFTRLHSTNSTTACLSPLSPQPKQNHWMSLCKHEQKKFLCKPAEEQNPRLTTGSPAVDHRFTTVFPLVYPRFIRSLQAVRKAFFIPGMQSRTPTQSCLCKPFSFRGCLGICEIFVYLYNVVCACYGLVASHIVHLGIARSTCGAHWTCFKQSCEARFVILYCFPDILGMRGLQRQTGVGLLVGIQERRALFVLVTNRL